MGKGLIDGRTTNYLISLTIAKFHSDKLANAHAVFYVILRLLVLKP